MIRLNSILLIGVLAFTACKPQELSLIHQSAHRVRVNTVDGYVYAELAGVKDKIFTANHKQYAWYGKGLIHFTQGDYSGKLLNGQYEAFSSVNKHLKEKGEYAYGLKRGKWQLWRPDGHLLEVQRWRGGLKHGRSLVYDSLGRLKEKQKFSKGKLLPPKKGTGMVKRLKGWLKGKKKK